MTDRHFDGEQAAVGTHRNCLHPPAQHAGFAATDLTAQSLVMGFAIGRRNDDVSQQAVFHLAQLVAEHALGGGVELNHPARLVDGDDGVESTGNDGASAGFAVLQARFGFLAPGDVAQAADDAPRAAFAIDDQAAQDHPSAALAPVMGAAFELEFGPPAFDALGKSGAQRRCVLRQEMGIERLHAAVQHALLETQDLVQPRREIGLPRR